MLCQKHLPKSLMLFGVVATVACLLWGWLIPAELRSFYNDLMKVSVLGWTGYNALSVVLAVVQGAIWGGIIGYVLVWCARFFGCQTSCGEMMKK